MQLVIAIICIYILGTKAFRNHDNEFTGFGQPFSDHNVSIQLQFPDISISSFLSGWEPDIGNRLVARQFQCENAGYSKSSQPPFNS
jgi:hypothetical protein